MSHIIARSQPAPIAGPLTAAMTGTSRRRQRPRDPLDAVDVGAALCDGVETEHALRSAISLTLPPAEKILPAPVRITARTVMSALAASTAVSKAAMKSVVGDRIPDVREVDGPVRLRRRCRRSVAGGVHGARALWSRSCRQLQGLHLQVLLEAEPAEFAADAGLLVPAERRGRVVLPAVDVELTGLHLPCEAIAVSSVGGPDRARQAVGCAVGDRQRVVGVAERDDGQHGPKTSSCPSSESGSTSAKTVGATK